MTERKIIGVVASRVSLLPFDLGHKVFFAKYFVANLSKVIDLLVIDGDKYDAVFSSANSARGRAADTS